VGGWREFSLHKDFPSVLLCHTVNKPLNIFFFLLIKPLAKKSLI
jgi:hypothetical protein